MLCFQLTNHVQRPKGILGPLFGMLIVLLELFHRVCFKPSLIPSHRGRSSKPIFVQIAKQVVNLNPLELRLPSRAWKVKLVGEGADDAGGVFDDTITEMCQVGVNRTSLKATELINYVLPVS